MTKEVKNSRIGRPSGSPNKRTTDLLDICERLNCNPFEVLVHFAKGDSEALGYEDKIDPETGKLVPNEISKELRQKSAKDACEYLFPKRKAVEHTGADGLDLFTEILREIRNGSRTQ